MRYSTIDHQKLLLEAGTVIKRGGPGVNVQVQQNNLNSNSQPGSFFSKFVSASDKAAYDVIDIPVEEICDSQS